MTEWIFISDLHASLRLPHANVSADGTTSDRLTDVIEVLEDVRDTAREQGASAVWILGDLFHERHPDAPTLTRVARALRQIADVSPLYILPGNHDAHGKNADVYSISMFNELDVPGITVIDEPSWWCVDEVAFCAIPWVPEDRFAAALDEAIRLISHDPDVDRAERRVLLMHQTITGADAHGRKLSGLPARPLVEAFDLVLSGHIHQPQKIGEQVRYLGSPLPLSFSEADGLTRGFWLLDDDLHLSLVENEDSPGFIRWRFRPGFGSDLVDAYEELIDDLEDELVEMLATREVYVDVRVSGPRAAVDYVVADVATRIDMHEGVRMRRINRVVTDDGSDRVREASRDGNALSPAELVRVYSEANESFIPDGAKPEEIRALGEELLKTSSGG